MFNVCHLQLAGVDAVHDLHVWTLKPGVVMLTTHIVTTTHKPHLVLHDIEDYCKQHGIHHPTIQIEGKHHTHLSDEDVALIPSHHSTV
jgi:Co/Zn/Cd efflux system component